MKPNRASARALPAKKSSARDIWIILGILVAIFFFALIRVFGAISYNFFVAGDNLLKVSNALSPFVMWGVFGACVGSILGSVVVCVKYRLDKKWILPSLGFTIILTSILYSISGPINSLPQPPKAYVELEGTTNIKVSASSSIPDFKQFKYGPDRLLDNNDKTAWMFVEKIGQPTSVSFVFEGDQLTELDSIRLNAFKIATGFQKNYKKWLASNKPKDFEIFKNDTKIAYGTLQNSFVNQTVSLDQIVIKKGDVIRFDILSSYKTVKRKINIIAVSTMIPIISVPKNNQ